MQTKPTSQQFREAVYSAIKSLGNKEYPTGRKELVTFLNNEGYKCEDRAVRRAKEDLILLDGIRVETSTKGGYYIPNPGDTDTCGDRFLGQGLRLLKTAKVLLGMSTAQIKKAMQKELDLEGNGG